MQLKINVTKKDIMNGHRDSTVLCPIARAAKRAGITNVRVDSDSIHGEYKEQELGYTVLPLKAQNFISRFDESNSATRKTLKPFSFVLRGL